MATVTKTGVKWIKVSKTDALGNSYDDSWRLNNSIRINYSDIGSTQYNINTVTEYPTYWLLGLNYANPTSSLQGAKDYRLLASASTTQALDSLATQVVDYKPVINTLGYFDDTSDKYGLQVTPNIPLQITGSAEIQNNTGTTAEVELSILQNGDPIITNTFSITAGGTKVQCSASLLITASYGYSYSIQTRNNTNVSLAILGGSSANTKFIITQSVAPASNTITILDPFITTPFEGTDCDVTYGLVDQTPYSQYRQDIDYSTGATIPTNQQLLISGTATPAQVKDYYYQYKRHILPRYEGSRGQGYKYNVYTPAGILLIDNQTLAYEGDKSYGTDPLINYQRSFAARFQYIAGYSPERFNTIFAYVTDLVDENGNVFQPKLGSPTYYTLAGSFEQGDRAIVTLLSSQNASQFSSLNSEFPIHKGAQRIEPILYTSNGIEGNTTPYNTMSFNYYGVTYDTRLTSSTDFTFTNAKPVEGLGVGYEISSSATPIISYSSVIWPGGAGQSRFNKDSGVYTFGSSDLVNTSVQFELSTDLINYTTSSAQQIVIKLQEKTGSTFYNKQQWSVTLGPGNLGNPRNYSYQSPNQYQVKSNFFFPIPSASYRFTIEAPGAPPLDPTGMEAGAAYAFAAPTQIKLNQQVDAGNADPTVGDNYFTTGSDRASLTASIALSSKYKSIFKQVSLTGSGYNPVTLPFTPQPGDEIRFNNLEAFTYMIYDVKDPKQEPDGKMKMLITPPLPTGSNINTNVALIRRYVPDANYILLEGGKPAGGTPGGIIRPKYITSKMADALDNSSIFTLQAGSSNPL